MENSNTRAQEVHTLWISQDKHIVSFHEVKGDDYEQFVFKNRNDKMEFVFQKCSCGFRIQ